MEDEGRQGLRRRKGGRGWRRKGNDAGEMKTGGGG